MVWSIIGGAVASTATRFGGDVMNKINNMFSGVDVSDKVTIHPNVKWTYRSGINLGDSATPPTSPINGDIFFDSTRNQFRGRINNEWIDLVSIVAHSSYPMSDETSGIGTGILYTTDAAPYTTTIDGVELTLTVAGTGTTLLTVDVHKETASNSNVFSTIFSTKPTMDSNEFTSQTATVQPVLSTSLWEKGRRLRLILDNTDGNGVSRGLKITIRGNHSVR